MSMTLEQIYALNPTTVVADTDLYYLVQSPYTPGTDSAITGASLKAAFGAGGTINPGLGNQLAYYASGGSTISGLATAANGVLITSGAGAPSISQTLPNAVQDNISRLGIITSGTWNATTIGTIYGGTGLTSYTLGDTLYASAVNTLARLAGNTTTTKNFLSQTGSGVVSAAPVWSTISASDIGSGQALTRVDDTNVTLTLGGTPATALLQAVSLTLGWTGTLSGTRGGTGVNNGANTITLGGSIITGGAHTLSGAFASTFTFTNTTSVTFPTSGTLATTSQIPTGAALTKTDDTNVTLTLGGSPTTALVNATSLTLGWTGQLSLTRGGTNASLTASNGGIIYSTASAFAVLAGTATANQIILSGSSTSPSWSTATYPATTTINQILYSSSNNTIVGLATANSAVLVTSSGGVPSLSSTLPAFTTSSITFNPTTSGIVGTTTNDSASAGFVGEIITSAFVTNVAMTSAVSTNITSISLTAGDWDVHALFQTAVNIATVQSFLTAGISTTSATLPTPSGLSTSGIVTLPYTALTGFSIAAPLQVARLSLASTTTVYLVAQVVYSVNVLTGSGILWARRAR